MATSITININDEDEGVLNRLVSEYNGTFPPPTDLLTPAQFFRQHVRDWIRSQAGRFYEQDQLTLRQAYKLATPEEQAQIDAILNKYR